ncbi:MAG: TauD/TfdA family dioxygenase [Proteobacteria bacterium]|nr:TauD/TfdA family dioxygenase [Pseudomonadota bacterium]
MKPGIAVTLQAKKLHKLFAAEIAGIDMRSDTDARSVAALIAALNDYAVCVVPHEVPLSNDEHIAFSALLGPMERNKVPNIAGTGQRVLHSEIVDQSNLDGDGNIYADDDRRLMYKRANRLWHTDMSFYDIRATWSLLSAHMVPPEGGETEFSDMRAVYDDLPDAMKTRLDGLVAEHSYWHSRVLGGGPEPSAAERATRPLARHRLVHKHPGSGRKVLYIASHVSGIVGWPDDEAKGLLAELMGLATQPPYIYSHVWSVGEVLIWDNLATMHRATPFDDQQFVRDMRRTTCRERAP